MRNLLLLIGIALIFTFCAEEKKKTVVANVEVVENETPMEKEDINIDLIIGNFDPAKDKNFVELSLDHADRAGLFLHQEVYESFQKMYEAALQEDVKLKIVSATRNFQYQKGIWERKWSGATLVGGKDLSESIIDPKERALKILEYSSMPGTSRHHWGTDLDLNNFENSWFEEGEGLKLYMWLENNASKFGFCRPYTKKGKERPNGYNEEKWHWSYRPLSKKYTQFAKENLSDDMISGFLGSEAAIKIGVVEKYVLGINKECL